MIPKRLLPQRVTYAPYLGSGPEGDVYGDPITVPARVQFQNKLIRDNTGSEVISAATIYMQPQTTPPTVGTLVDLPDGTSRPVIAFALTVGARTTELLTVEVS